MSSGVRTMAGLYESRISGKNTVANGADARMTGDHNDRWLHISIVRAARRQRAVLSGGEGVFVPAVKAQWDVARECVEAGLRRPGQAQRRVHAGAVQRRARGRTRRRETCKPGGDEVVTGMSATSAYDLDLRDVRGQIGARRALEVAAAGGTTS